MSPTPRKKWLRSAKPRSANSSRPLASTATKQKNVIQLSQQLIAEHGSQVPRDRDALEKLAGVGRKTANVVMNVAYGEPTMAVDTHVFRVANRIGLSTGKNPLEVEQDLLRIIPPEYGVPAHHWLILHGRYLCKAPQTRVLALPDRAISASSKTRPHHREPACDVNSGTTGAVATARNKI